MKNIEAPKVWAWEIDEGLCWWAWHRKDDCNESPSPEARKRRVRLIRETDYQMLLQAARSLEAMDRAADEGKE